MQILSRLFLLLTLGVTPCVTAAEAPRPNVLFIVVDDMNDWINGLGGYAGKVRTPNLDRLAARGTLFTNAHCASPKCSPSRAAVLTGRMPSSTGIYDNGHWWYPHMPEVVTIPMHFRNNGYRVEGAGKIHHHTAGSNPPHQWDAFEPLLFRDDPWFRGDKVNYPWSKSGPKPPGFPFSGVPGLGSENDWGSPPIAEADMDDVHTVDASLAYLKAARDKPFFIACGLFRPHLPWYVPKAYFDLYNLDEIVLPKVESADLDDVPKPGRKLSAEGREDFEQIQKAGKWRQAVQAYLASISFADAQIGRLLDGLDASPQAANTVIVLWSDHGWHLGEKEHWHKSTLWERATRVPFIIAAPGYAPGRCARPVNLIDLYPTLIELCGLPASVSGLDGLSLVPLLRDPQAARERPSVTEFKEGNAAVRDERYRYIRYQNGGEELYDHQDDPQEWHNRAADPAFAKIKTDLAKWLPKTWAPAAPDKKAFVFDPSSYSWTEKATGRVYQPSATSPLPQ